MILVACLMAPFASLPRRVLLTLPLDHAISNYSIVAGSDVFRRHAGGPRTRFSNLFMAQRFGGVRRSRPSDTP